MDLLPKKRLAKVGLHCSCVEQQALQLPGSCQALPRGGPREQYHSVGAVSAILSLKGEDEHGGACSAKQNETRKLVHGGKPGRGREGQGWAGFACKQSSPSPPPPPAPALLVPPADRAQP